MKEEAARSPPNSEKAAGDKSPSAKHVNFEETDSSAVVGDRSPTASPKPHDKSGPARRRQPSFREESPPLYDLYAISVS